MTSSSTSQQDSAASGKLFASWTRLAMLTSKTASRRPASSISQRFQRAFSNNIFSLQLACWPYKRASPVQQLPPELLAEIFTCCLPAHENTEPSISTAPLNISAVCRSWRELALSIPRLWARFKFLQNPFPESDIVAVAAIGLWLERSRRNPLSFTIGNEYRRSGPDAGKKMVLNAKNNEPFMDLFGEVLGCQKRWKRVDIDYDFEDPDSTVEMEMSNMPLLEDLHVRLPVRVVTTYINISRSPHLRSLSLSCRFMLVLGRTPFTHLRKVHLDYGRLFTEPKPLLVENVLMVLQKAPGLEELSAVICGRADAPESAKKIRLPALRKLFLHFYSYHEGGASVRSVLNRFSFPSLENFELRLSVLSGEETFGVADLLSRSQAPLTSFKFWASPVRQAEILECLRLSPSLVHLSLVDQVGNPMSIITALTLHHDAHAEYLCPKLETIQFSADDLRFAYEDFATMIASRWKASGEGCSRLQEVRLREQDTWFVGRVPYIRKCVEEGLRLVAFDSFSGREWTACCSAILA